MTNSSSYMARFIREAHNLHFLKPAKRVFIKDSLKYGGLVVAIYLLTGLALKILGL